MFGKPATEQDTEAVFTYGSEAPSGMAAVAGIVVGNMKTRVQRDLLEFKEQLTVLLVGLLFVLLSADVRLSDVTALGWAGVATVDCDRRRGGCP